MIATLLRLGRGELELPVPQHGRADEICEIFSALAGLRDNALARQRLEDDLTLTMANGDARRQTLEQNIAEFCAAILAVLQECSGAVDTMQSAAR